MSISELHNLPIVALLFAGLALGGCKPPASTPVAPSKMNVLSVVLPFGDLVKQVGGDYVTVDSLCETGQDARDLQMTDDFRRRLAKADLVIGSGYGEHWISGGVRTDADADRTISPELTDAAKSQPVGTGDLWLDPVVARQLVDIIRQRLAVKDPAHEPEFRANADRVARDLETLDRKLRDSLAPWNGRKFLVPRAAWAIFARRYGLQEIAPVDVHAEHFDETDIQRIRAAGKRQGVALLAVDAYLTSGVVRQVEAGTALKVIRLDRTGSSIPDARSTYQRIMEYNLAELVKGFEN